MDKKIFVISDLLLFDEKQLQKLDFPDFETMNDYVVARWNETVDENDVVVVMGILYGQATTLDLLKEVIIRLNGSLSLISYEQNNLFSKEELKEIGFVNVWNAPVHDIEKNIAFCPFPLKGNNELSSYDVVIVDNTTKMNQMVENNRMKGDAFSWNYNPLELNCILDIYKNMKEFAEITIEESESRSDVEVHE